MFSGLSKIEKVAAFVATGIILALIINICLNLKIAPSYSDFIVGHITWNATTKFQDIILGPVVIAGSFFFLLLFSTLLYRLKNRYGNDRSEHLANQLILWSTPGFAAIIGLFLKVELSTGVLVFSAMPIITLSIISTVSLFKEIKTDIGILSAFIISVIFISLIPVEIYLLIGRATDILLASSESEFYSYVRNTSIIIFFIGMNLVFYCGIFKDKIQESVVKNLIFAGQLGLPLLFLLFYPAKLIVTNTDGNIVEYNTTVFLKILVAFFVLIGFSDVIRRYIKNAKTGEWKNLFSPIAIFSIIILLKYGDTIPPSISQDDYHFGERLIGWWSYMQGAIPYLDYIPSHGIFQDDFALFFSAVFYDSTASSVNQSYRLGLIIFSFAAFISMLNFSKSLKLSFFIVFFSVYF